jgi:hypothetical protein
MPSDNDTVQIVITRRGANTFRVVTFSKKECLDSHSMDDAGANEFIAETMKKLKALKGVGDY